MGCGEVVGVWTEAAGHLGVTHTKCADEGKERRGRGILVRRYCVASGVRVRGGSRTAVLHAMRFRWLEVLSRVRAEHTTRADAHDRTDAPRSEMTWCAKSKSRARVRCGM